MLIYSPRNNSTQSVNKFGQNLDPKEEIRESFENGKQTSDALNLSGS